MTTNSRKTSEKELYEPIKKYLLNAFTEKFGNCYLEVTAQGVFSEPLKSVVSNDIIFHFLGRKAAPDLTGFIHTGGTQWTPWTISSIKDFVTVEIKNEKITLQDVYQAKMYGDLFQAKYALLVSSRLIPEEIKRLDQRLFAVTHRYMTGWHLYIGCWSSEVNRIAESEWLPRSPYED